MSLATLAIHVASFVSYSIATSPLVFEHEQFEVDKHADVVYAQGMICAGSNHHRADVTTTDSRVRSPLQFDTHCADPVPVNLTLDLYMPVGAEAWGARPALVAFHSGGYTHGDKDGHNGAMAAACRHFASRGFIAITVEYRVTNDGLGLAPGNWSGASPLGEAWRGGFNPSPAAVYPAVRDSKAAIRWLRSQADDLALNPSYVGALGWSAGACTVVHLATGFEWDFTTELTTSDDSSLATAHVGVGVSSSILAGAIWAGNGAVSDMKDVLDGRQRGLADSAPLAMYRGDRDTVMTEWAQQEMQFRYNSTGNRCDLFSVPGANHRSYYPDGAVGGTPIMNHTYSWMTDAMGLSASVPSYPHAPAEFVL